jgi:hypothetical protein
MLVMWWGGGRARIGLLLDYDSSATRAFSPSNKGCDQGPVDVVGAVIMEIWELATTFMLCGLVGGLLRSYLDRW